MVPWLGQKDSPSDRAPWKVRLEASELDLPSVNGCATDIEARRQPTWLPGALESLKLTYFQLNERMSHESPLSESRPLVRCPLA